MFCFQCQQTAHNKACEGKAAFAYHGKTYSDVNGFFCKALFV
ncbi:MAG: hypothetical protein ACI4XF_09125 [Oscillospiraceae bacterium]